MLASQPIRDLVSCLGAGTVAHIVLSRCYGGLTAAAYEPSGTWSDPEQREEVRGSNTKSTHADDTSCLNEGRMSKLRNPVSKALVLCDFRKDT